tara:strand:- start:777 stop:1010 length:234 start_codon:yes stop_codon:yes gene_type:complete
MTDIEKINLLTSPEFLAALLAAIVVIAWLISDLIIGMESRSTQKKIDAINEKYAKERAADIATHRAFCEKYNITTNL